MKDVISNMTLYDKDNFKVEAEKVNSSLQITWSYKTIKLRQQLFIEHRFSTQEKLEEWLYDQLNNFYEHDLFDEYVNKIGSKMSKLNYILRKDKQFYVPDDGVSTISDNPYKIQICNNVMDAFIDFNFI